MIPVPPHLQRLADQIDGWLDLRCPERVLELLPPMLADPAARPAGLTMRIRAYVRQARCAEALVDLAELRTTQAILGALGNLPQEAEVPALVESATIRRRRECAACAFRFTTYERVEAARLIVIKRDGTRQEFDRERLASGLRKALTRRPVPDDAAREQ